MENESSNSINIKKRAKELDLELDSPVIVLPQNFETATNADGLFYNIMDLGAIKYLKKDVDASIKISGKDIRVVDKFADTTFVITFFVQYPELIPVIITTILELYKFFKKTPHLKARVIRTTKEGYEMKEIEGPGELKDINDKFWE